MFTAVDMRKLQDRLDNITTKVEEQAAEVEEVKAETASETPEVEIQGEGVMGLTQ